MDALSQIIRLVRLQASLDLRCQFANGVVAEHAGTPPREIEFHLVLAGSCVIEMDGGESVQMAPGDFAALRSGTPHRVRTSGQSDPRHRPSTTSSGSLPLRRSDAGDIELDILCGRFKVDSSIMDRLLETLPRLLHVSLSESTPDADLRVIVAMIRSEVDADAPGAVAIVEALSTVLLTLALRIHGRRDTLSPSLLCLIGDTRMARATQAILTEPGRDWTLEQLAGLSAMSRATFARRFTAVSATTPGALLLQVRMSRAADLLERSTRGVADIGAEIGYQSEAAFSKAFKRATALSPSAYRRERAGGDANSLGGSDESHRSAKSPEAGKATLDRAPPSAKQAPPSLISSRSSNGTRR